MNILSQNINSGIVYLKHVLSRGVIEIYQVMECVAFIGDDSKGTVLLTSLLERGMIIKNRRVIFGDMWKVKDKGN